MDEAEDVAENLAVVRLLLEAHQLRIDPIETLIGLGQELAKQIIHEAPRQHTRFRRPAPPRHRRTHAERVPSPLGRETPDQTCVSVL